MSAVIFETSEQDVVWNLVDRQIGNSSGDVGAVTLENSESGERRVVSVLELRGAGFPGFSLQPRYALSVDGVFRAV